MVSAKRGHLYSIKSTGDFLFHRKLLSYEIKNAPLGSHCGGKEDAAKATRRRRSVSQARHYFYNDAAISPLDILGLKCYILKESIVDSV